MVTRKCERQRVRFDELTEELADATARRLGCPVSDVHAAVAALVSYLAEEYATTDFYIPAPPRELPVDEIREAMARGESVRSICRRYRSDRRTIYRVMAQPANGD